METGETAMRTEHGKKGKFRSSILTSLLLIAVILVSAFLSGCEGEETDDTVTSGSIETPHEKITYDEIKAMHTLIEFAVVCDDTTLELVGIMSDDFTKPFLAPDVEITEEEYNRVLELEDRLLEYEDDVLWALQVLESKSGSGSLVEAGSAGITLSLIMPKASASPSPGLISAIKEWFDWLAGRGKVYREKTVETLEELKELREKGKIEYGEWNDDVTGVPALLDLARKSGIDAEDIDDLIGKLKSGKYDRKAKVLYGQFLDVPLFHEIEREKTGGKNPRNVRCMQESAEFLEKTGQVGYEGIKAVTGVASAKLPGNTGEKIMNVYKKGEKFINWWAEHEIQVKRYGWKKGTEEWIKDRIQDVMGDEIEERLGKEFSKKWGKKAGEMAGELFNSILYNEYQRLTGYERYIDPLEEYAEKGGRLVGKLILKDKDRRTPVKFAAASSQEKMITLMVFYDEDMLEEPTLPDGEFEILFSDMDTMLEPLEKVVIESGKEKVIEVDSSPKEIPQTSETVTGEYKLTVKVSPSEVTVGGGITVYGKIDPPVVTTVHITIVNKKTRYKNPKPFEKTTDSKGCFKGHYSITTKDMEKKLGDCEVIVTAPELGVTGKARFRVVKPSLTVGVMPSKVKKGREFVVSVLVTPAPGKDMPISVTISNSKTGYRKVWNEYVSGTKGGFEGHYHAVEKMVGKNVITVEIPGTGVKKSTTLVVEAEAIQTPTPTPTPKPTETPSFDSKAQYDCDIYIRKVGSSDYELVGTVGSRKIAGHKYVYSYSREDSLCEGLVKITFSQNFEKILSISDYGNCKVYDIDTLKYLGEVVWKLHCNNANIPFKGIRDGVIVYEGKASGVYLSKHYDSSGLITEDKKESFDGVRIVFRKAD